MRVKGGRSHRYRHDSAFIPHPCVLSPVFVFIFYLMFVSVSFLYIQAPHPPPPTPHLPIPLHLPTSPPRPSQSARQAPLEPNPTHHPHRQSTHSQIAWL